MEGRWVETFDFSAQDPPQYPNKRNIIRACLHLFGQQAQNPHSHHGTPGTMVSTSSAAAPTHCCFKSNKFPHPPNQIFIVGLLGMIDIIQPVHSRWWLVVVCRHLHSSSTYLYYISKFMSDWSLFWTTSHVPRHQSHLDCIIRIYISDYPGIFLHFPHVLDSIRSNSLCSEQLRRLNPTAKERMFGVFFL